MADKARQKAKRPIVRFESYLFKIERVRPHYGFGIDLSTHATGPYAEYHHTEIAAVCVSPKRLNDRFTIFTLMADRRLVQELEGTKALSFVPTSVGTLTVRGEQATYLGSLPHDAALQVPNLILSGGYHFIYLSGDALRYGSARIRSISFYEFFDLADL